MSVISKLVEKRIQFKKKKINSQKKARKGKGKKKGIKQPGLSESTKRVQI